MKTSFLYHFPLCPFSRAVRMVLIEKHIECTLIAENFWQHNEQFMRYSPFGQVPVFIEPEGKVFLGFFSICEYLNDLTTHPSLMADNPRGRAEIRRLMELFGFNFYSDVVYPILNERVYKVLKNNQSPLLEPLSLATQNLKTYLAYLAWLCAHRNYLVGKEMSLADIVVMAQLSVLDYLGQFSFKGYPDVEQWFLKMQVRDSYQSLLKDEVPQIRCAAHYREGY